MTDPDNLFPPVPSPAPAETPDPDRDPETENIEEEGDPLGGNFA